MSESAIFCSPTMMVWPGVVAALIANDEVGGLGEVVGDPTLALVTPLRSENDVGRHAPNGRRKREGGPASRAAAMVRGSQRGPTLADHAANPGFPGRRSSRRRPGVRGAAAGGGHSRAGRGWLAVGRRRSASSNCADPGRSWFAPRRLGQAIRSGALSLGFIDSPSYDRWTSHSDTTFQSLSEGTGVPVALLTVIREAMGSAPPSPDDRVREDELLVVPLIQLQHEKGFRPGSSNVHCACTGRACGGSPRPNPTGGAARS